MKRRTFLELLALAGAYGPAWANNEMTSRFEAAVAPERDFSGVILIADKGELVFQRALGFRTLAPRQPMIPDAIFEIASLSKAFTSMIVMMLKVEGKLNYDDLIARYLPDFPYAGITLRHALSHTSGLPDIYEPMDAFWDKTKVATNDDIIAILQEHKPPVRFAPGDDYYYTNTGYIYVAAVIEKITGRRLPDLLTERIFQPLGMKDAAFRTHRDWDNPRFALGYLRNGIGGYKLAVDFSTRSPPVYLEGIYGHANISMTADDLLTWDRALYGDQLIPQAVLEEAFQPMRLNTGRFSQYGLGWTLARDDAKRRIVYHTGVRPGYRTYLTRFTDLDRTLIVLCNNAYRETDPPCERINTALAILLASD